MPAHAATTFDDALARIVERDIGRLQAEARVEAARSAARAAGFHLIPAVDALGIQSLSGGSPDSPTSSASQAGFSAQWSLFRSGSDVALSHAAEAELNRTVEEVEVARFAAERQGADTLLGWIDSERQARIQERLVENRKKTAEAARERFQRGLIPREQSDAVAVDLSNTEAQAAQARLKADESAATLRALLGGDLDMAPEWPWQQKLQKEKFAFDDRVDLERLPTWRSARFQSLAAESRADAALRGHFPTVDAQLSYLLSATRSPTLGNFNGPEWSGTVTLTLPLFHRGAISANADARTADLRVAELEVERLRRSAPQEWEQSLRSWRVALESAKSLEATRTTARRVAESTERRFRAGRADANDLTVDVSREVEAELLAEDGWFQAHSGLVRACHARGERLETCLALSKGATPSAR
jgi:outer membrane protein TolC